MNNIFDLHHQIEQRTALILSVIDSTTFGIIIDTAGFTVLEFIIYLEDVSPPDLYVVNLQHGDNSGLSDVSIVSIDETLGNATFTSADTNSVKRIGYIGKKRYCRFVVTPSASGTAALAGIAILGSANHQPVAD